MNGFIRAQGLRCFLVLWGLALFCSSNAMALRFASDVPSEVREQAVRDLEFMANLQGTRASSLHTEIFGPRVDGSAYAEFFNSHVSYVGLNECGGDGAVACVIHSPIPLPFLVKRMWLTSEYLHFQHPAIAKMMVFYHEARHTERNHGYWTHAKCPAPFQDEHGNEIRSIWTGGNLGGQDACDTSAYGSYSSSLILLKNIQKFCTNCTEKVREDAGIYADDQLKRVIDPEARALILRDLYE